MRAHFDTRVVDEPGDAPRRSARGGVHRELLDPPEVYAVSSEGRPLEAALGRPGAIGAYGLERGERLWARAFDQALSHV